MPMKRIQLGGVFVKEAVRLVRELSLSDPAPPVTAEPKRIGHALRVRSSWVAPRA